MKTRYYILALAATALLASCSKDLQEVNVTPAEEVVKTYLTVGIDPTTKTQLGPNVSGSH